MICALYVKAILKQLLDLVGTNNSLQCYTHISQEKKIFKNLSWSKSQHIHVLKIITALDFESAFAGVR